jgi:hypothetical protein
MPWLCLKCFLILSLARGVPGDGPDCHFPKAIVGFGPIPARIRIFLIFILPLSSARMHFRSHFGSSRGWPTTGGLLHSCAMSPAVRPSPAMLPPPPKRIRRSSKSADDASLDESLPSPHLGDSEVAPARARGKAKAKAAPPTEETAAAKVPPSSRAPAKARTKGLTAAPPPHRPSAKKQRVHRRRPHRRRLHRLRRLNGRRRPHSRQRLQRSCWRRHKLKAMTMLRVLRRMGRQRQAQRHSRTCSAWLGCLVHHKIERSSLLP